MRAFFKARHVLEVETPILGLAPVTDPHIQALKTRVQHFGERDFYMQTSPEYYLKRLLAAYPVSVYQLGKVFRDDEYGEHHSPEFTMLEWYRLDFNDHQLMDEMRDLFVQLWGTQHSSPLVTEKLSYKAVFLRYLEINPHQIILTELQALVSEKIGPIHNMPDPDFDICLQLLMSAVIEPALAKMPGPVFIYDFPASQAALARLRLNDSGEAVSGRFEVYWQGLELANGYDELTDAGVQAQRFEKDLNQRQEQGLLPVPVDQRLLAALASGIPSCAGVALGFDRLVMILGGYDSIQSVQSFYDH
ncbi:MAG: EF-P lysine aminoacylase EpmA [Gammaproteobacteria bacterium]|nr:EF-P lysine aminoacylase EpmA [Gammaproteobacteria bacterium]